LAIDILQILDATDIPEFINQVRDYIANAFLIPVRSVCHHPFGIGMYKLDNVFDKDLVITSNMHDVNGIQVSFINHDHALNRRNWD
jgi:hypothetical protein